MSFSPQPSWENLLGSGRSSEEDKVNIPALGLEGRWGPLFTAIKEDNLAVFKEIINDPSVWNAVDPRGDNPLHVVVKSQRKAMFDELVMLAPFNDWLKSPNNTKLTPLFLAAQSPDPHCLRGMFERGADRTLRDFQGNTLLHAAVSQQVTATAQFLLENGADIDAVNDVGKTALAVLCSLPEETIPDTELASMLLYYNIDVNAVDFDKNTAFVSAMINEHKHLQELLFDFTFQHIPSRQLFSEICLSLIYTDPYFDRIFPLTSEIDCTLEDMDFFVDNLYHCEERRLKLFIEKFSPLFGDYVRRNAKEYTVLAHSTSHGSTPNSKNTFNKLRVFIESGLAGDLVLATNQDISIITNLLEMCDLHELSPEETEEFICIYLSYGAVLDTADLHRIFNERGFCELFRILLYMEIRLFWPGKRSPNDIWSETVICALMYDMTLDVKSCYELHHRNNKYLANGFVYDYIMPTGAYTEDIKEVNMILAGSNSWHRTSHDYRVVVVKYTKLGQVVPTLLQLARDATRTQIIERYEVRRSCQYYTILDQLPLPERIKDVLTFRVKLYSHLHTVGQH